MTIAMSNKFLLFTAAAVVCIATNGCRTAPKSSEGKADIVHDADRALAKARQSDPTVDNVLDDAHGIAVFPKIGKGAVGVGGAYGKGVVYEMGHVVGYCDVTQGSVGFQLGGQTYTEIICFEDAKALGRFKDENLTFSGQATAVALKSGAGANADYRDGVCVFTTDESGLMFEASLGGQRFSYQATSPDDRVAQH